MAKAQQPASLRSLRARVGSVAITQRPQALGILVITALVCAALSLASMTSSRAQLDRGALDRGFLGWIESEVWPQARRSGITRDVFESAFSGVALDLDLPELVLPDADGLAIDQAEFRHPADYFDDTNLANLTRIGRDERGNWSSVLSAIASRYGVPQDMILAVWGRESAFGRASIPHYAIAALATQAYLGRRADAFLAELIAALHILQAGDVDRSEMMSSWAGALGLPQFLPSAFDAFAVDFDGDGRRDIWRSVPDALASIANYLSQNGWVRDLGWGEPVEIPAQVSCTLEGPHQGLPAAAWEIFGFDLAASATGTRYLLMPAGRLGPAFLVTDNFYVLKTYNQSDLYALFVGHLADRISGTHTPFQDDWHPLDSFTYDEIQQLQRQLERLGYDVGGADGLIGHRTRISVGATQGALGFEQTCFPDGDLIGALR